MDKLLSQPRGDEGKNTDVKGTEGGHRNEDQSRSSKALEQRQSQAKTQPEVSPPGIQQSSASPLLNCRTRSSTNNTSVPRLLQYNAPESTRFSQKISALTHNEALLFRHFTVHLTRWLDCTNAMRLMTLRVPEMAREFPILRHAILCFAARHRREDRTAEAAYQRCITLLIDHLNEDSASYDEMVLIAVILLHFADQLNGKPPL
jgi:hypothetical protein